MSKAFGRSIKIAPTSTAHSKLFFSILNGILPFLAAFSKDKFQVYFLTSSLLTLLKFYLDLEWKFLNLILWTLSWFWKVFLMLSTFVLGSILVGLSFRWVAMFVKNYSRCLLLFLPCVLLRTMYCEYYGCSFVAKLSWKKKCVFYKIYIICRKKCFYM